MGDHARTPKSRALAWWKARAEAHDYVVGREDVPGSAETAVLKDEGYLLEVGGGVAWIVARPGIDTLPAAFYPNYWRIVRRMLRSYAPAVVERISAVRLHSQLFTPPALLTIRQDANASRRRVTLVPGYDVQMHAGAVDPSHAATVEVDGLEIAVDAPAATLLGLPVPSLREDPDTVAIWLKSLVLARPELEAAYEAFPRPVVLKRIGLLARQVGNERLADQIESLLRGAYGHSLGRGHTNRGPAVVVPTFISGLRTTRLPWLDRHAVTFARFRDEVEREVGTVEAALPRFASADLLKHAHAAKVYDAYHSTSIEGYRIGPDEVSAIVRGEPVGGHDPEQVRSRMAVAGYSRTFETVLRAAAGAGPTRIDEPFIQELYVELFGPSVDAGLASPETLRGWRNRPAYLRDHSHVPPSADKVPRLMRQFEDLVNSVEERPLVRAVMAHYEFVTIHPFPDGNGRISRFLMNLCLVGEGLPWVTIRVEDRARYFASLQRAQVDGDPAPFARLVAGYVEAAVEDLAARRPPT
ncbi:MAG: Fic/DOC family protein [Gemmatimonadetes bacterium]|nr:Fic/DOC family protein [Gemmatimonadota bacterium]